MLNLIKSKYVRLSTISINVGERVMFTAKNKQALRSDFGIAIVQLGGVMTKGRVHISTKAYTDNRDAIASLLAKYDVDVDAGIKSQARSAMKARIAKRLKRSSSAFLRLSAYVLIPLLAFFFFQAFGERIIEILAPVLVGFAGVSFVFFVLLGFGSSSNDDFIDGYIFGKFF